MENRKCPALVDGKECGLALILVERDIDAETDIYKYPRSHRKNVMIGEIEKRKCPALIDGKACGLALTVIEREIETATEVTNARWATAHTFPWNQKLSRTPLNSVPAEI